MSLRFQNQNAMREPEFQAALLELLTQLNSNVSVLPMPRRVAETAHTSPIR